LPLTRVQSSLSSDPDEKRPFEIRTETTVAGVRGTEFFMSYGRLIEENPDIWLCVNMGVVEVAVEGRDETVSVEAGEGITIPGGETSHGSSFL
jgi:ferric-dicitrate binding protein FerR (iron transport regulator)